jgi:hypothetical protein
MQYKYCTRYIMFTWSICKRDDDQPLSKERSRTWTESYMEEHLRAGQNKIRSTYEKLDFLRISMHQ